MEPVDAERARQLSLFRPLGTSHFAPGNEPLRPASPSPWRVHWFLVAADPRQPGEVCRSSCSEFQPVPDNLPLFEKDLVHQIKTSTLTISFSPFAAPQATNAILAGASYYTSSVAVRPEHYEELINRGWRRYGSLRCRQFYHYLWATQYDSQRRRSGTLYYKQNLERSCCPYYTMRLEASAFTPRRDQRKAINRWNKFILGPEYIRKAARLCPQTREEKRHRKCNFDVVSSVHETEYSNVKRPIDPDTKRPLEPAHKFEVNIEGDSVSQAKFDLFAKYQTTVHREDVSRWKTKDFERFLCSGLKRSPNPVTKSNDSEKKLGSWHQCYRLDGKLIAVAVLDMVPNGVSSVYIFYDPAYEQWEFGKLSALREIAFALENSYPYYYMGFYIHSCQKMRYKANFRPQYLLDPESYAWHPLNGELSKKLDTRPYVSLSRDQSTPAEDPNTVSALDPDVDEQELSLFDIHMPGALTLDQVKALNLDNWHLLYHGNFVQMEDLVGWEKLPMNDPQSVKGIIAELAAVLGPKIVKNSAVVLFD
ncbi:hypothetical protein N7462_003116 [Penicillium macrosclerotiorum]|uniref:uncharacterized protein n=1 Tax=Penicillium macrosclerotiorum TaxID=303699 RepID=UPI002547075F|nr:uncharacterized protein N7462_003116 [Penicillium macrosclerotiorum]KAJ5688724.1 hypothetical protein N7462_003116 [Penicillium macrosclerotiorum]